MQSSESDLCPKWASNSNRSIVRSPYLHDMLKLCDAMRCWISRGEHTRLEKKKASVLECQWGASNCSLMGILFHVTSLFELWEASTNTDASNELLRVAILAMCEAMLRLERRRTRPVCISQWGLSVELGNTLANTDALNEILLCKIWDRHLGRQTLMPQMNYRGWAFLRRCHATLKTDRSLCFGLLYIVTKRRKHAGV